MNDPMLQLAILGAIALFLILKLRSVLGTRTGYEPPKDELAAAKGSGQEPIEGADTNLRVIEGGIDRDIADHIEIESEAGKALLKMKKADPSFNVNEFIGGARQAYEMILMAFENDDQETLSTLLSKDVFDSFTSVIDDRQAKGLSVNAEFVGVREVTLKDAEFNARNKQGEVTLQFVGELTSEVVDAKGKVIEGDKTIIKRQKDVWTFARKMGADDPNWQLVATGG